MAGSKEMEIGRDLNNVKQIKGLKDRESKSDFEKYGVYIWYVSGKKDFTLSGRNDFTSNLQ